MERSQDTGNSNPSSSLHRSFESLLTDTHIDLTSVPHDICLQLRRLLLSSRQDAGNILVLKMGVSPLNATIRRIVNDACELFIRHSVLVVQISALDYHRIEVQLHLGTP